MNGYEKPGAAWRAWVGATMIFAVGAAYGVAAHRQSWFPISAIKSFREASLTGNEVPTHPDYRWSVEFLRRFSGQADIAMVGDSITAAAQWAAIFPGRGIINLGVGRDNTAGILARMDTIERRGAKLIFLMAGTNDFNHTGDVDAIFGRYLNIVERLSVAASVVVISTLLVGKEWPVKNERIAALNQRLQTMCHSSSRCVFLDLNPLLAGKGHLDPEMTVDGTHLTPSAYAVWAEAITPIIDGSGLPDQ